MFLFNQTKGKNMKKIVALLVLVSFGAGFSAEAGYYRTKNSFTGRYESTGRVNSMGTHRAPNGYHTGSYGMVYKNSIW